MQIFILFVRLVYVFRDKSPDPWTAIYGSGRSESRSKGHGVSRAGSSKESESEANRVSGDDSTSDHSILPSDQEAPESAESAAVPADPTLSPLSTLFVQVSLDERSPAVAMLSAVLPTTVITSRGLRCRSGPSSSCVALPVVDSSHKHEDGTNFPT